jgi:Ca-activated chloride channel family protein
MGLEFDEQLLERLADLTGGRYYYVDQAKAIPPIFAQELKRLQTISTADLKLTLVLSSQVEVQSAYEVEPIVRPRPVEMPAANECRISLGDLDARQEQRVLVTMRVRVSHPGRCRLARVTLSGARSPEPLAEENVIATFAARGEPTARPAEDVRQFVKRVQILQDLQRARGLADARQHEEAAQLLQQAAQQLHQIGQDKLARLCEKEAGRLGRGHSLSPEGAKALTYGIRSLI